MGSFELKKCCFCIDLKTGCFIIGYLSLIGYIILALVGIVVFMIGGAIASEESKSVKDEDYLGVAVIVVSVMFLLVIILLLTFIIILLVGLHKNKPGHVKAYLIYASVYVCISFVLFITSVVSGKHDAESIFEKILNILLSVYFILVIRSQYLVMKHPERVVSYNA